MENIVNAKLIFVLLDGLNACTAESEMGFMSALAGSGQAFYQRLNCELPPLSRPLYHCLFTGESPMVSGIVSNTFWRPRKTADFFALARKKGLETAASAYYWVSELCNKTPYDPLRDRFTANSRLSISYGVFYDNDAYPDISVFTDAEILRLRRKPDLLLVHSMGIDYAGHTHGGDSPQYREAARNADMLLAALAPRWLEAGYELLVTADHGMDADKSHNGDKSGVREVPLWFVGGYSGGKIAQTDIFGLVCARLGL